MEIENNTIPNQGPQLIAKMGIGVSFNHLGPRVSAMFWHELNAVRYDVLRMSADEAELLGQQLIAHAYKSRDNFKKV